VAGVTIGLLGGFSASVDGNEVADRAWRLKKGRELVKLLALARGHRLHREQAMDVLWRELDPGAAANNLNQAVHVARRVLGSEAIDAREGLLVLSADVDVDRFEEAAGVARRVDTVAAYRAALALYGGELLPENRYDDFAVDRREDLAGTAVELARRLDRLEAAGGRLTLPADASSFVGRRHELAELRALLPRGRLLTLTGTGGAGKTRLALELARAVEDSFAVGAAIVELASVAQPGLVADAVAAALEVRTLPGQPVLDALAGFLAPRELLLVLDNCEHVLAPCAALVDSVLRTAPHVSIIVTSREPLRLPGEVVFRVPSLGIPDPDNLPQSADLLGYEAVGLFVERAAAVAPGFALDEENAPDVARICFRLDGLPLALELAAGRVGGLAPSAIAARLDDRFRLLRAGTSHAPTRQQTLAATLRWSHDLLEPDERVLFRRLAVFAGGFELGAAEAVCTGDELSLPEVADILGRLVEKSLVSAEERGADRRYRLLETVRLYALEQLVDAGEASALSIRHAHWALALAEFTADTRALDREAANLRAALDTLAQIDPVDSLRLCAFLLPFWLRRIDLEEADRCFTDALDAVPERTPLRAEALLAASAIRLRAGTTAGGHARAEESLEVAVEVGDTEAEWRALQRLADFAIVRDDGAAALRYLERALAIARTDGPPGAEPLGICTRGVAHWLLGEPDRAEECLAESLALFRPLALTPVRIASPVNFPELLWAGIPGVLGPRFVFEETLQPLTEISGEMAVGHVLINQSGIARARGEFSRARGLVDEAEAIFGDPQQEAGLAAVLVRRAYLELAEGDLAAARVAIERALELRRGLNDRRGIGMALAGLGLVDTAAGDLARAAQSLEDACALFRRAGDRWGLASALWRTSDLELVRGRFDEAEAALDGALAAMGETGRPRWFAHTAFNRAEVSLARGDLELARMRFAEARGLYLSCGDRDGLATVEARAGPLLSPR
jgi:predicted ATPase